MVHGISKRAPLPQSRGVWDAAVTPVLEVVQWPGMHLYFADREEWRSWLERNHSAEKEAWLVH